MMLLLDNLISVETSAGESIAMDLGLQFDKTYQQAYDGIDVWIQEVMQLGIPSDKRVHTFGMMESLPVPELWRRGDPIPTEGTGAKRFSVVNYTYAKRIPWHREDREDSLAGDVLTYVRTLSKRMALVSPKAATEILINSATLLPAIPTCPDGAALFATTDGNSANRFGVSSGNLLTGNGTTAAQITTDFYSAVNQFSKFQDTKGEPYFEPNIGTEGYVIIAPVALRQKMVEALRAEIVYSTGGATYAAGVSNLALASGAQVKFLFTSRLDSDSTVDWYIFRSDAEVKPLFELNRRPIQEESALAEANNSDLTRNTGMEYVQFSMRRGYGCNVPFGAIKVNNT